jgi:hypothetical protein
MLRVGSIQPAYSLAVLYLVVGEEQGVAKLLEGTKPPTT